MTTRNLELQTVLSFFEQICAIPHGSGNCAAIADFLVRFAQSRSLTVLRDEADNVIISKPAAAGYETAPTVILQGHTDMVCETAADCDKDMEREGLTLQTEGDFLFAEGTTLGADDGIAVAIMLAILDSALPAPALEAVFTTDEETGMYGAAALDASVLRGRIMINIDSEVEGVFTVGCAGGNITTCTLPVRRIPAQGAAFRLTVSGLTGGHSGVEIIRGRANAVKLLARLLLTLSRRGGIAVSSIEGGRKTNAIPTIAEAVVTVDDPEELRRLCREAEAQFRNEFAATDPAMRLSVTEADADTVWDGLSAQRAICLLTSLPDGVITMDHNIEGAVRTSLNMGIVNTQEDRLCAALCIRSDLTSQKQMLTEQAAALTACLGGSCEVSGDYPGWQYRKESRLRDLMSAVYREQTGKEPRIETVHAGLECGLFAGKTEGLDCISIGPDILEIHTPRERLSLSSTARTCALVAETLRRCKS